MANVSFYISTHSSALKKDYHNNLLNLKINLDLEKKDVFAKHLYIHDLITRVLRNLSFNYLMWSTTESQNVQANLLYNLIFVP